MKQTIILFFVTFLFGCISFDRKKEVFVSDIDFTEFDRLYSPDKSMMLLNYGIDQGAFGYAHAGTAVLKLSDTTKNLRLFTIPNSFNRVQWLDNGTVSAKYDTIPFIRSGEQPNFKDTETNGIKIITSPYDYIEPNAEQRIEHRETSPNGRNDLVAYRYINDKHNLNFIQISVVPAGGQIPKYGNYFIADMQSDYILNGRWNKDNSLVFYSNNQYADLIQYYFVHKHPDIKYNVIIDDKTYSSKYRWTRQSSR